MIVTDCPDAYFILLKRLLPTWPKNLAQFPLLFNSWSMGETSQSTLEQMMNDYDVPCLSKHHALHDANALRQGLMYAVQSGWRPS